MRRLHAAPASGADVGQIRSSALPLPPVVTPSPLAAAEHPSHPLDPGLAHVDGAGLPIDDQPPDSALSCIAAFYPHEATMRDVARRLLKHHDLRASQLLLLGPCDADPVRFARHTLRWSAQRSGGHGDGTTPAQWLAIAAGLSMSAMAIGWWVLESDTPLVAMLVGLVLLLLSAVLLGERLAWPWVGTPRVRRFEISVQRQLSQGQFALVVHRIPRGHPPGMLALLRGTSLRWCAVARPSMRL
jgi:hypothetical protein